MFSNVRPLGREYRITPSRFETPAGRLEWPPKSRQATGLRRAAVRLGRRALGDGFAIRRDDFRQGIIPMDTPEKETPRHKGRGAVRACEDTDTANRNAPNSIFAEADRVIETFPFFMTRKAKHQAQGKVLRLFLAALAASRHGLAV